MIASHTVLWKNPRASVTSRSNPLLDWTRYEWWAKEQVFKQMGQGPLSTLAAIALDGAIAATRNVTITQQVENPETAPPADLLWAFLRVRPVTLVCRERPARPGANNNRWAISWITGETRKAQPQMLPEPAIQAAISALAKESYPAFNAAPSMYAVPALVLDHEATAESLGIIEPQKITPDMILAMVADDPDVREAGARWDRATPATHLALLRARCDAQARMGIAEADQALLYTSEVEDHLTPVVMKLASDDERATELRQKFRRLYGADGDRVLAFCLMTYPHRPLDGLKRAVGIAA